MKELVEVITKALVKDPDAVSVTIVQKGNMEVYQIHVALEDIGESHRQTWSNCRCNSNCSQSRCSQKGH